MSIASEITRLQNAKAALKTSINAKTDSSHQIDDETLDEYSDFVDSIQTGGGGSTVEEKDVNFYDYDGTLVDSYSKADFLALNSLPENPTHTGLTAQGWNWSLTDAKNYVNSYDELDIGQNYITDDEKTRIYIEITERTLKPYLYLYLKGTVTIDWGDGSASSSLTGTSTSTKYNVTHTYSNIGNYVITIEASTSTTKYIIQNAYFIINYNETGDKSTCFKSAITKIYLGKGITELGAYAFQKLTRLREVILPNTITKIGAYAFDNCNLLKAINIPNGTTNLYSYSFNNCYSLKKIVLPNSLSNSSSGGISDYAFSNCYNLTKIILPDSLTIIGYNWVANCNALTKIILPNTITNFSNYTFSGCKNVRNIEIPNAVNTTGNYVFNYCQSILKITIPSTLTIIKNSFCVGCYSLEKFICEGNVTAVQAYSFSDCYVLKTIDFTNCTSVPSLQNSTNVFTNTPTDLKIVVPDSLYDTWIAATNWSTHASKIIKESDFNA